MIDLGSGDGRIIIEAAKRGARGMGVDLDPSLVKHAAENAQRAGVGDRTKFLVKDIFRPTSRRDGRAVVPASRLQRQAAAAAPEAQARHAHRVARRRHRRLAARREAGDARAGEAGGRRRSVARRAVDRAGRCEGRVDQRAAQGTAACWRFAIKQKYQELDIDVAAQGRDLLVRNSRLRGEEIKVIVTGVVNGRAWHHYFVGTLRDDRITGEVTVSDGNNKRSFPWTASRAR